MRELIFPLFLVVVFGCTADVQQIDYGRDSCHWCQMRIMDPKFGAEAVTDKGRVYKFDSAECLLHYLNDNQTQHAFTMVTNYDNPGTLIPAAEAWYVVSDNMPSPMGGFLNAFGTKPRAEQMAETNMGSVFSWSEIKLSYEAE